MARTIDPFGQILDYRYDRDGNLITANFGSGISTRSSYDSEGNLTQFVDSRGRATRFQYDSRNNLTAFTDALGRTTRYRFDSDSNLVGIDYANGTSQGFTVDAEGDLTSSTNRRGQVIAFESNTAGQITKKTFADGSSISYGYDARGRLSTTTDATGKTTFTYDATDTLTKVAYPDGKFLQYTLNIIGQRTKSIDQDGFTTNYEYDDLGRLDKLTDGGGDLIVDYTYDAVGRVSREDRGNGTATAYAYDAANQLFSITHTAPGGGLNSKFEYSYDSLGRRVSSTLTDNDSNTADGKTNFGYDALGQLTSVVLPGGRTITYTYDAVGNRTSVTDNGVTTQYSVGLNNEYTAVGDTSFQYDADGNLIAKTTPNGTTRYSYNAENRLVGVNANGLSASYRYNALGQRSGQTVNGQTTNYLLDPVGLWSITAEYDGSGTKLANYTYGLGLVNRIANGASSYYDFDAITNVIGLTTSTGQYVNRYSYLPFGEVVTSSGQQANPFTFHGLLGVRSEIDGSYDMRFRSYSPILGRFASPDPLGLLGLDGNFYRFVSNDPVSLVDPLGLQGANGTNTKYDQFLGGPNAGYCQPPTTKVGGFPGFALGAAVGAFSGAQAGAGLGTVVVPGFGTIGGAALGTIVGGVVGGFAGGILGVNGGDPPNSNNSCSKQSAPPPNGPPGFPGGPGDSGKTQVVASADPNDITGPAGFGDLRFVAPDQSLGYTIRFENLPAATAAAQEVFITHPLDADLDPNTVELGTIGFRNMTVAVPAGLQAFETRVSTQNLNGSPLLVDVSVVVDFAANVIRWTFRSVNPTTGELPDGILDGILPPEDGTGRGQGFVTYTIRPRTGVASNTTFDQQASIVFDTNEPIVTNVFVNAIDADAPTSSVAVLPEMTAGKTITLNWSGTDVGSGIANYSVFVSIDGGAFQPFLSSTTQTTAEFTGEIGKSYSFFTVATDKVGFSQSIPTSGQASTKLIDPTSPPPVSPPPVSPPPVSPPPVSPPPVSPPSSLLVGTRLTAVGSGRGGTLSVLNADSSVRFSQTPFPGFSGAIRTATADLNGDGVAEIVAATGPGIATALRVIDGVTQQPLFTLAPFEASFQGGVYVAFGDVTGDGIPELIITPDEGGGPRVRVFDGVGVRSGREILVADYFGIQDSSFRGGARAAAADMNGDGKAEIVVCAGFLGGPRITIWDGAALASGTQTPLANFFAFEATLRNGASVAVGDVTGDGRADAIFGGGPGGGPRLRIIDGSRLLSNFASGGFTNLDEVPSNQVANFFAGDSANRGGIRLAVKDLDQDAMADLVVGSGPGASSRVTGYFGKSLLASPQPREAFGTNPFGDSQEGVFVG